MPIIKLAELAPAMEASVIRWVFFTLLSLSPVPWAQSVVRVHSGLRVGRGSSVYVTNKDLQLSLPDGASSCKVEVVLNEPVTQRVGKLTPQVFDCHFLPDEVKYIHNGSPLLEEDTVMLRIYSCCKSQVTARKSLIGSAP